MIRKITDGFVVQTFTDDGKPVCQEFEAGDSCEWEQDNGEFGDCIECPEDGDRFPYVPFQMIQPQDMADLINGLNPVVSEAKSEGR